MHLSKALSQTGENEEAKEAVEQASVAFGEELSHAAHKWTAANLEMGLLFLGQRKYRLAEQQLVYALTVRSEASSFGPRDEGLFYMAPPECARSALRHRRPPRTGRIAAPGRARRLREEVRQGPSADGGHSRQPRGAL